MTDKMLSKAEIDEAESLVGLSNSQWVSEKDKRLLRKVCAQAKLAIPKPRQDAGRVEAVKAVYEDLKEQGFTTDLPETEEEGTTLFWQERLQPLFDALDALTLEAKPQTDNEKLVREVAALKRALVSMGKMNDAIAHSRDEALKGQRVLVNDLATPILEKVIAERDALLLKQTDNGGLVEAAILRTLKEVWKSANRCHDKMFTFELFTGQPSTTATSRLETHAYLARQIGAGLASLDNRKGV